MFVSICIPTYKRPELLRRALRSAIEQHYRPMEILIGDDSPTDEARRIVESFPVHDQGLMIHYEWNRPALGQAANVNSLIGKARGEKLMILHDDDELVPNALVKLLACWQQDPDISAAFGKQILVAEDGSEMSGGTAVLNLDYYRTSEFVGGKLSPLESALVQQFPNDCALLNSELAKRTPLRELALVGDSCDFDFGVRFAAIARRFWFADVNTAKYRLTEGSISKNFRPAKMFKIIEELELKPDHEWARQLALGRQAPLAISEALKNGDRAEAWRIYCLPCYAKRRMSLSGLKKLALITMAHLKSRATSAST